MSSTNTTLNTLSTLSSLGVDLSKTVDPIFYGYAIAIVLFGITIVQVWIYVNTNHDKWPLRCLVGVLFLLDLTTTCLDTAALHEYLVSNFGNLLGLLKISKSLILELLLTLFIILAVEIFFASRVYLIGKFHWIIPLSIALTALGAFIAGIDAVVDLYRDQMLTAFNTKHEKLTLSFSLALSSVSDIISTSALSWAFAQSRTGIKRTDTLLQKLFQYTVTRGFFVTLDQTILLILILVGPEKFWWMPFHLSVSKVYVITMVAMLNSRETLHNLVAASVVTDTQLSTSSGTGTGHGLSVGSISRTRVRLHGTNGDSYSSSTPGADHSDVINVSAFPPRPQVGGKKQGSVSNSYIEMDDYERKVVLITRETTSEVV